MGVELLREENGFSRWVLVEAIRHYRTGKPHARATFEAPKVNRIELGKEERSDKDARAAAKAWVERLKKEGWKEELSAEEEARIAARIAPLLAKQESAAKREATAKKKRAAERKPAPAVKLHPVQAKHQRALVAKAEKKGFDRELLARVTRPCVDVLSRKATKADLATGKTRIGGAPDLPAGARWPKGKNGPMVFVAQLDLADFAKFDGRGVLPKAGHLFFFAGDFDEGAVLFAEPKAKLARQEPPQGARFATFDEKYPACGVDLRPATSLPRDLGDDDDEEREEDAWFSVWLDHWSAKGRAARHRVIGHHFGDTEGIEPDDEVLLALDSDDRAGMGWGDAGTLYFVIPKAAAAKRAWRRTRVVSTA